MKSGWSSEVLLTNIVLDQYSIVCLSLTGVAGKWTASPGQFLRLARVRNWVAVLCILCKVRWSYEAADLICDVNEIH